MLTRTPFFCLLMILASQALTAGDSGWTWLGPEGGSLGPFAYSSQEPASVFAASNNGVFRSQDGGVSWVRVASGLTDPNLHSMVRSGQALLVGSRRQGAFRSVNRGESWSQVDLGAPGLWVQALAVDPQNDSRVFAGTAFMGIFRSIDGGQTWSPSSDGLPNPSVAGIAVSPVDSDVVYASLSTGVARSVDGGQTWADANLPFQASPSGQIVVNRQGEPLVAAFDGIYRLRGGQWTNLLETDPLVSGSVTSIALHPTNSEELLAGSGSFLIRSRDGGATFQRVTIPNIFNLSLRGLSYDPESPERILVGATAGTFLSGDSGATWSESREGLRALAVTRLGIDPDNPLVLFGTGLGGAFKTVSRTNWTPIRAELDGQSSFVLAQDAQDSNLLFVGNFFGLYRSRDAGLHWQTVFFRSVRALGAHPTAPGIVFAAVRGSGGSLSQVILRSVDAGVTWVDVTGIVVGLASDILLSRADTSQVWVATTLGVFHSTQMGGAWQLVDQGLADRNVLSLEESPNGSILAGTRSGRVFRLDDPEGSWTELTQPTTSSIQDLVSPPGEASVIYAATNGDGLLVSLDGGEIWNPLEGLENPYPSQIRFSRDGRRLYSAGSGGVYELVLQAAEPLGISVDQEVSGNRFPRGTVNFSVHLGRASGPAGATESVYRYRQALPLGLQLVEVSADSGEVFAGPGFNSVTWRGDLQDDVTLQIRAELLDGTTGRDLATQGVLTLEGDTGNAQSISDDPSLPSEHDATVLSVGPSPFQTGVVALPRSLPIPGTFVGVALLNRTESPAEVEAEGITSDGATVETNQLEEPLNRQAQTAMLTSDLLSSGQTALFQSPGGNLEGFFLLGDFQLERMDGVGGALMDSQRLILPRVQQGGGFETQVYLFNPDSGNPVQTSIEFRANDGQTLATAQMTLAGRGSVWAPVRELFPELSSQDGYLYLNADRPLRGFELIFTDHTFETLAAQPIEYADRFFAPHAFFGEGVGATRLRLVNTGARELRVKIQLFADNFGLLGEPEVSLAAGELRVLDLSELFGGEEEPRQGWLQVDAASAEDSVAEWPSLVAVVEYQSADGSTATTLRMVSHPVNNPAFLQVAQSSNLSIFQGLAMVPVGIRDPLRQFTSISIELFAPSGSVISIAPLASAGSRISGLLNEPVFFGEQFQQEGGHMEVPSPDPLAVFTIFGGPRFLSAVDAQGVSFLLY